MSPNEWANKAIQLYHKYQADRFIAEVNQGWDMVKTIINNIDKSLTVTPVVARRGKDLRAEPIAALYEQGKVHHVGSFPKMENEMTTWVPGSGMKSPNRIDALVHGLTSLLQSPIQNPTFSFR
jgi:phage terminase large subunit-like protein